MKYMKMFAVVAIASFSLAIGCATLKPGADPLVVRTEQALTMGKSSFDLVVLFDHANRPFWATNAPAFHAFAEWLRQPQPVPEITNTLPRAAAMLYSLDVIKRDYQASKASSNYLWSALVTFESAANQASAWLVVATNAPASINP